MKLFTFFCLGAIALTNGNALAQINIKTTAVASGDTIHCIGGDYYKSALAYHPGFQRYYSNNAGGSVAEEYFDISGNYLGDTIQTDWRGLWYNSTTGNLEGNTWLGGFIIDTLSNTGALGYVISGGFGVMTPDPQSAGAYNYNDLEILFYNNDSIYAISRINGSMISSRKLTGISDLSNVVSWSIIYTGIPNNEVGIYDKSTKQLYLYDIATASHSNTVNMPSSAPVLPSSWNIAYTNDLFWLYSSSNEWIGYEIFDNQVSVQENKIQEVLIYPNPTNGILNLKTDEMVSSVNIYNLAGQNVMHYSGTKSMDVSDLPTGIYQVIVTTENGQRVTNKLVRE